MDKKLFDLACTLRTAINESGVSLSHYDISLRTNNFTVHLYNPSTPADTVNTPVSPVAETLKDAETTSPVVETEGNPEPADEDGDLDTMFNDEGESEQEPDPKKKPSGKKPRAKKVTKDDMLTEMRTFVTDNPTKRNDLKTFITDDLDAKNTDALKPAQYPKVVKWCRDNG